MKISFIIASVDRNKQLGECIRSIEKAHEYSRDIPIEILVVIQKVKQKIEIPIHYPDFTFFFYIDKIGLSVARNFAIAKSSANYFVFLDDDAAVKEDFIYVFGKKIKEYSGINAFCGRLTDISRNIPFSVLFGDGDPKKLRRWNYQYFMGSGHVLGKEVIEKIGLYDERFGVGAKYYGSEESDIFFRLKADKEQVIYLPELNFYHPVISASSDYVYKYSYGFGAVLVKNCINDKAYFFVYCFIFLGRTVKVFIRILQKLILKGMYEEKDKKYHYSSVLRGMFKGLNDFVVKEFLSPKTAKAQGSIS